MVTAKPRINIYRYQYRQIKDDRLKTSTVNLETSTPNSLDFSANGGTITKANGNNVRGSNK